MAPFVDADWLRTHPSRDVALVDVRWTPAGGSGRAAYEEGHIPGAIFMDLDTALSAPPSDAAGRHPLPSPEDFAAALGSHGIGDGTTVVAYDGTGGLYAGRLVWMLRAIGQDAALLDGDLQAWSGPLETTASERPRTTHAATPWPARLLVSIDDVASTTDRVIDARDRARFDGGPDPFDPRSGHIPGADSLPSRDSIGADGRLLSREELRERFAAVGIEEGTAVISYCGSGVTACLNLLALQYAGLGTGRLYPGSWSQWSRDPARPIATAAES
jgi:thiosulfate/3-mercaptopyruvate sulfurtransferase